MNHKKSTNPKVSVVMSVFDEDKYLQESIDSILNQTYKNFEFIIINDGSTDRSRDIIRTYDDPRIRLIENDKNIGLTRSLNNGLKLATGIYIARMDADDASMPERLEKEVNFLNRHQDVGLVGTHYFMVNEKGSVLHIVSPLSDEKELKEKLLTENQFGHGSVMFRKECLEKVGFYREKFRSSQDYDLWLRISDMYDVANIPEPLYKWRVNPGSISVERKTVQDKYAYMAVMLAKERRQSGKDSLQTLSREEIDSFFDNAIPNQSRKEIAQSYCIWGRILLGGQDYRGALKLIFKALINDPLNGSAWVLTLEALVQLVFRGKTIVALRYIKSHLPFKQVNGSGESAK